MNKMDKIILGLDVSTSCIGICVFHDDGTENGTILRMSQVVYKDKDFKEASTDFGKLYLKKQKFMQDLKSYVDYGITNIVIEEPLLSSNNEYTVATLLRFNGMIAEGCIDLFHIDPIFISSYDARKYAFPSLTGIRRFNKKGEQYENKKLLKDMKDNHFVLFADFPFDIDKKEVMMNKVNEVYPNIPWLRTPSGKLKKENYDANDALITCLGLRNKLNYGEFTPTASEIEETTTQLRCKMNYWNGKSIDIVLPKIVKDTYNVFGFDEETHSAKEIKLVLTEAEYLNMLEKGWIFKSKEECESANKK